MKNFLSFVNIDFLAGKNSLKNWRMLLFVSMLLMFTIYSSHSADQKIFLIAKLNKEVNTLNSVSVSTKLDEFLTSEVLPDLNITSDHFWHSLEVIIQEFGPRNRELLELRESMQQKIDDWHMSNKGQTHDFESYKSFLKEIGYLTEDKGEFTIETQNVDPEIATIAGPQLVVPVMNARFALNAANARWGSLYDALYGTDMIPEDDGAIRAGAYNPVRGDKVIAFAKNFLDDILEVLYLFSRRISLGPIEKDMSISESEVQMIDAHSKNIDIQDIGLFWQLTIKTIHCFISSIL